MTVATVTGELESDRLGLTLCHEHLFIDIRNQFHEGPGTAPDGARTPVGPEHHDLLEANPYAIRDNLLLDDPIAAIAEVGRAAWHGCTTIVDCTPSTIGGAPGQLRQVALRTGISVIAGCGYYTADTHPAELPSWSMERIADFMLRDLVEGIEGSGIRAGIIGELGTSREILPGEDRCLRAAARAFRTHPVAIYVHTYPWATEGVSAASVLLDGGVDPRRIVICHSDVALGRRYIHDLLALGVFVEFDNFGKEFPTNATTAAFAGGPFARDRERVDVLRALVNEGYVRQLLLSNDVCLKSMLHCYGGRGYDHLLATIVPALLREGVGLDAIDTMLQENPKELLAG
jgi:phosphotriesterase-related protein